MSHYYGQLTGHGLGRFMRDSARRVIHLAAGKRRFALEFTSKETPGKDEDFFSGLDVEAQKVYERMVRECIPGAGFVAEEGKLRWEPANADGITITSDGIDGTGALKRQQSHGIGTMVAAVKGNEIIGAYVGDVCTGEIYGFHPDSTRVSRIVESMHGLALLVDPNLPLTDQRVLLRDNPSHYSMLTQRIIQEPVHQGSFDGLTVMGGSIGTWFAMLWKGEAGCAILRPHSTTPWDWCPVMGITERLGFKVFYVEGTTPHEYHHPDVLKEGWCPHELIIVHESRENELREWLNR